jgi:hypothetical protein
VKDFVKHSNHLGIFLIILFIGCFLWYWIHPVQKEFHLKFLQSAFFGFKNMNILSFIFGIISSYIYGYVFYTFWALSSYLSGCKHNH